MSWESRVRGIAHPPREVVGSHIRREGKRRLYHRCHAEEKEKFLLLRTGWARRVVIAQKYAVEAKWSSLTQFQLSPNERKGCINFDNFRAFQFFTFRRHVVLTNPPVPPLRSSRTRRNYYSPTRRAASKKQIRHHRRFAAQPTVPK